MWGRWAAVATLASVGLAAWLHAVDHPAAPVAVAVAGGLVALRLVALIAAVARGRAPWTRLLLPAVVALEALAWSGGGVPWQVRLATLGALELAVLGIAARAVWRARGGEDLPEVALARALAALLPPAIARLAALELVIVGSALRWLAGGWRTPAPAGFSYHRESGLRLLLPVLPLLAAGDWLLLELLVLPRASLAVRIAVHAAAAYGLLWLLGIYATARARPHQLRGDQLALHRGVLRTRTIPLADVAAIGPLPAQLDDWQRRAYLKGAQRLDLAGSHALELRLRDGGRVIVGVDDPAALIAALRVD